MKVILDTTILNSDHFFKATEMVKLRNLCNEEKIDLIIPKMVLLEFITQERENTTYSGKKFLKEIKYRQSNSVYESERNILSEILAKMEQILLEGEKSQENKINTFLRETNAKVINPTIEEYDETIERYIKGDKPFKTIKSREDLPDGIIFTQTKNINGDMVIFISNDKNLREAVASQGITVFSKLSDFIASDTISKIIAIKKADDLLFYNLPSIIETEKLLEKFFNALEEELIFKKFTDEKVPDDNNEGTISGIIGIDPIEFTKAEIIKLGEGLFSIPFYCEIDTTIEYYFFKADYCCLDEDRIRDIYIENWNDHYYQAEEEFPLICTGKLGIQFNLDMIDGEKISNIEIENLTTEIKISFSDLEIRIKEF
jgi:rRNA-processing protein FCF1